MKLLLSVRIYRQLKAAVSRWVDIFFNGVATGKILIIPHISPYPCSCNSDEALWATEKKIKDKVLKVEG